MTKAKKNPDPAMFSPYERETLLRECYERGLLLYSSDAASVESTGKGFWVPVSALEAFVDFIITQAQTPTNITIDPNKPYVGRVFRLQRHKAMPVKKMDARRGQGMYVNTNKLFPEYCMILDEYKSYLCVLGNDNTKYWITRFYFGKAATDD